MFPFTDELFSGFWPRQPALLPVPVFFIFMVWAVSPLNVSPSFCWFWIFVRVPFVLFSLGLANLFCLSNEAKKARATCEGIFNVQTVEGREISIMPRWDAPDAKAPGYIAGSWLCIFYLACLYLPTYFVLLI